MITRKPNHPLVILYAKNFTAAFFICLLLAGCGGTTRNLSKGYLSNANKFAVKSYAGCCGCAAEYFNIYHHTNLTEQVVYKYNCYTAGMPTKFIFNYDEYGQLLYCSKSIATTGDDFEEPLSDEERGLFLLLDKDKILNIGDKYIKYNAIKGFRKVKAGESSHQFPLIKHGSNVKVK